MNNNKAFLRYQPVPAGTAPVAVGAMLSFSCKNDDHSVGDTLRSVHDIECGADGSFPSGWPECAMRCLVPEPEEGYDAADNQGSPVGVGTEVSKNFFALENYQFKECIIVVQRTVTCSSYLSNSLLSAEIKSLSWALYRTL